MYRFIYIYKKRIHLNNSNRLIIQTGSCAEYMKDVKVVSYVNGTKCPVEIVENPGTSLLFIYKNAEPEFDREYNLCIDLPKHVDGVKLILDKTGYPAGHMELELSGRQIDYLRKHMELNLVGCVADNNGKVRITGWVECKDKPELAAYSGGQRLNADVTYFCREDIVSRYPEGEITKCCGFEMTVEKTDIKKIKLVAECNGRKGIVNIGIRPLEDDDKKQKQRKLAMNNRTSYFTRALNYIAVYGMRRFLVKVYGKITGQAQKGCHKYFMSVNPGKDRLDEQRHYRFESRPLFSILIPVYRPNPGYFARMLESIASQTYDNWQVCLADGGGENHTMESVVQPFIDKYGTDKVKYVKLDNNLNIAGNTNEAMKLADGDFIVFGDHDDELHPTALFECMMELKKHPETDFIYSDEDKIIEDTNKHSQAHFKPDLNMELLRGNNYICHLVVVKRTLAEQVGSLNGYYNGAQDYDYVLRCVEQAACVRHIPKLLYHWRINKNSTAKSAAKKDYANEAGKNAVKAHLERVGIWAEVTDGIVPGFYEVRYTLKNEPLVSVIIPNKNHIEDLEKCLESMENISDYRNVEYIVVENNSTDEATFAGYDRLTAKYNGRLAVVRWDKDFNYSAINNFGVGYAKGEYILLLNNDTSVIAPDTLRRMVSQCQRDEVGIVGAKLLYDDNTIQHAGITLGYQGVAGHAFVGLFDDEYGYNGRAMVAQEVSAVTAACLLTKKSVYEQVGGLDEGFRVAFNDIDYCMKVRAAGYKIIYEPNARLHHYESKSRGADDTAGKQERFYGEVMKFINKWRKQLSEGDPYYNPNLDLIGKPYNIKDI